MSLIQEALRRKDDQDRGTMAIPPKQVPPVIQLPGQKPPKKSKAWLVLAVSLVAVLLLIVVALGLLVYSAQHLVKPGKDLQQASMRGAPVPPPSIPTPATVAKSAPKKAAVKEPARSPIVRTPVVPSSEPTPAERKIVPPSSSTRQPRIQQTAKQKPTQRTPLTRTRPKRKVTRNQVKTEPVMVPESSEWPKLSLLGVMARKTPKKGSAIINNMVIEVGEEVAGVRLLEVQRNGILLKFNGETQFVRVGQSTY